MAAFEAINDSMFRPIVQGGNDRADNLIGDTRRISCSAFKDVAPSLCPACAVDKANGDPQARGVGLNAALHQRGGTQSFADLDGV